MNGRNLFGVVLVLVLGAFIAFTTVNRKVSREISPDELHQKIIEKTRYFTPEDVAHFIISEDPALQLIDVRDPKNHNKFTLKGAFNIPLNELLKKENLAYLDQDAYKTIFFSNGSTDADVAWLLATRLGYKNVYVMKGGMNAWIEHILDPREHSVIWDRVDDEMYQYRKGASKFFGGKSDEAVQDNAEDNKPKPKTPTKGKKKEVEGGCG
ncbi:MAG: rhodanese-like domain-containing protein [Bacteroidales bacterium]|nr:rhodanese-like domain-containing protein [Bacteroidales bacterium]